MKPFKMWLPLVVAGVLAGAGTAKAPSPFYTQVVNTYMEGKWDTLETTIKNGDKEIRALERSEAANVATIKSNMAESRGTWWNAVKAKKKMDIKVALWGRPMTLTFDPELQGSWSQSNVNNTRIVTVNWLIADMDSTAAAEHGFTKGDLGAFNALKVLGIADTLLIMPPLSMQTDDAGKLAFLRYLEFRGNITGAEYGTPRSRQWAIFLSLLHYKREFEKVNTRNSGKALGAMFMAEVLSRPKTYPSIQLPKTLAAEDSEETLALALAEHVVKNQWTFAEDNELRAAIKTFGMGNLAKPHKTGQVELPNKLMMALDPEADKTLLANRNKWIKQTFDRIK